MAKKNIEGQLDMFELFDSVEELEERIKGVPEPAEEKLEQEAPSNEEKRIPRGSPVMQKTFVIEDAAATVGTWSMWRAGRTSRSCGSLSSRRMR